MAIYILNKKFESIHIIDSFESFIWTDRYLDIGDFELYTGFDSALLAYASDGNYLVNTDSEHVMIIESRTTETDSENGNHIKIVGRSLESILTRRIVWTQTNIAGNLQNGIKKLITDAIISPNIASRAIPNFVFEDSSDSEITKLKIEAQFTGDDLYEAIKSMCEPYNLGFKITLNRNNQFVFKLYKGQDHSFSQDVNQYVIFSPKFDNIVDSNYLESSANYKNVTLIGGEGEGSDRVFATVGDISGLERRELFTDARDLSTKNGDVTISASEYQAQLQERGVAKLAENRKELSFDGQVEAYNPFCYGEDFFMGDIVQLANEYGMGGTARVTEFIRSYSDSGIKCYPTFTAIEEE